MKIYNVVFNDIFVGILVYSFDDLDVAIAYARRKAKENSNLFAERSYKESSTAGNWLFYADYKEESYVFVVECELNHTPK